MQNEINVEVFKNVVKKASLDLALNFVRIKFKDGRLYSGMRSTPKDIVTILDFPKNELIKGLSENDEFELNLGDLIEPIQTFDILMKHTGQTTMPAKISDGPDDPRIYLSPSIPLEGQTISEAISFPMVDESMAAPLVLQSEQKTGIPYFCKIVLTQDHIRIMDQIKAHGVRFGKMYVIIENGKLSLNTTDQNNMFSADNAIQFTLDSINTDDKMICFDHGNFSHLLQVIVDEREQENPKDLTIGFAYVDSTESGIIHVFDNELTEQYFLFSRPL